LIHPSLDESHMFSKSSRPTSQVKEMIVVLLASESECFFLIVLSTGKCMTCEDRVGWQLYRGTLQEAEDNMNCSMTNVTLTGRDGAISTLEQVFIRGGLIRFIIIPDILKNAPMFKRIDPKQGILRGKGVGIGRATVVRGR
jgi:small nuclear ribonucleoprotein D3